MNSSNKVWFITGASRGFGAQITIDALARGDAVVATARNPASVTDAIGRHERLKVLSLDVNREDQAKAAARAAIDKFGRIDVLVNNAGYGLLGAVEESAAEEVEAIFSTNVFGLLHVTRAVLPYMREARSGNIINISSIGGYAAYPGWGVYGATKFAVEGLTEALAYELEPLGIHATVVEPGFFRTDFLQDNSLVRTRHMIVDYEGTVGEMRRLMAAANGKQPGDPLKFSKAMLALADAEKPPVRLPVGSDTIAKIGEKHRHVEAEAQAWHALAVSTDHDDVAKAA